MAAGHTVPLVVFLWGVTVPHSWAPHVPGGVLNRRESSLVILAIGFVSKMNSGPCSGQGFAELPFSEAEMFSIAAVALCHS